MRFNKLISLFLFVPLLALNGCGSDTSGNPAGDTFVASEACIKCHDTNAAVSSVTGAKINEEYARSSHSTAGAASCIDCHGTAPGHPNSCGGCHGGSINTVGLAFHNPEPAGMCGKCHNINTGYDTEDTTAGLTMNTKTAHFNNITGSQYPASFVSYNYVGNCRKCHNPHDTKTFIDYNKDWARSSHGTTESLVNPNETNAAIQYDFRNITRHEYDFKAAGTLLPASVAWSDNSTGLAAAPGPNTTYASVCVRCHTSTGYINYVKSGFTSVRPFGPNNPATGRPYMLDEIMPLGSGPYSVLRSRISSDKTRELTNCNVCHDDGKENAYSFKLRQVPRAVTYYNYSGRPVSAIKESIRGHRIQFPDAGDSNMCVVCHSGRLLGDTIKMVDRRGIDWTNVGRIVNHFRGSALMLFADNLPSNNNTRTHSGFEFYTSAIMYSSDKFSHRYIGTNQIAPNGQGPYAGDSRGYGPCIGCHLNSNRSDGATSHTFLPVNREANDTYRKDVANPALPITTIVSKACPTCHTGDHAWTPAKLQEEKAKFHAAYEAFRQVLAFCLNTNTARNPFDGEGRPQTPSNWYGTNTSGVKIQPWLRDLTGTAVVAGSGFVDPLKGGSPQLVKKAAYNMGAAYNFFMFYYDPGAFAHNGAYTKRLMYDSIDWLDNGALDNSVSATFNGTLTGELDNLTLKTKLDATTWQRAYDYLMEESGGLRPVP